METYGIHLTRMQKIALSRIVFDLIEADFIVEKGEMSCFEDLISHDGFRITNAMLVEGKRMDLSKALSLLADLDEADRRHLVDVLKSLAMSDGTCVPLEAIQIFAIEQVLTGGARMYSVPAHEDSIKNLQVIFIENETGTAADREITANYAMISRLFAEAGFEFVDIPHIRDDFRLLNSHYLRKVVRYMIPSAPDNRIDSICERLCTITTKQFCRDLLYRKIGLSLIDARPSLLVKISDSFLIDQFGSDDAERTRMGNFLLIELGSDIVRTVRTVLEAYVAMINCRIPAQEAPKGRKFLYYGFHRSLFDLIAFGREMKEYKLVFDFSGSKKGRVYFRPVEGTSDGQVQLRLNPQETTLLALIARKSVNGNGLSWRELDGTDREAELAEYNAVYRRVGKGNSTRYFSKDRSQIHNIRNKIRALGCIANAEMFLPENFRDGDGGSFYRIRAPREYIEWIE